MKIKIDHVTNSSSASFMIPKSSLTEDQIRMIKDHIEMAHFYERAFPGKHNFDFIDEGSGWKIEETDHSIKGHTWMDNFNMLKFLEVIGVNMDEVHYDHS